MFIYLTNVMKPFSLGTTHLKDVKVYNVCVCLINESLKSSTHIFTLTAEPGAPFSFFLRINPARFCSLTIEFQQSVERFELLQSLSLQKSMQTYIYIQTAPKRTVLSF